MKTLKFKYFDSTDELCKEVNANPNWEIIQITESCGPRYLENDRWVGVSDTYTLFYKSEE